MKQPEIMVALRDEDHVEGLIKLACDMSKGMGAHLTAVHVVEVAPALPLDAESETLDHPGKEILGRARELASGCGFKDVATRLIRAREAGPAIVSEAEDQGAELLVMGYHSKGTLRAIVLGSTVQHVAHHAPCRVVVQIEPSK